jgi:hypothetical protein
MVYVVSGFCEVTRLDGCLLRHVTIAGNARYLRIVVNPHKPAIELIARIGHELQHALEVAEEPSIVDAKSLHAFYREHGISMSIHSNGWDTEAARLVGEEIRRDLASARNAYITESLQGFDPRQWYIVYRRAREATR